MRLLVLHRKKGCGQELAKRLVARGYVTDTTTSADLAEYVIKETPPDICLMNMSPPGITTIRLLQAWRKKGIMVPIIVLSEKNSTDEIILSLTNGADDCIRKEHEFEELIARINALIRRSKGCSSSIIRLKPYELHTDSRQLKISGKNVELTLFEYLLLENLMLSAGKIVPREKLMQDLYPDSEPRDDRIINVLVCRLRKKLELKNHPSRIETLKKSGYLFRTE